MTALAIAFAFTACSTSTEETSTTEEGTNVENTSEETTTEASSTSASDMIVGSWGVGDIDMGMEIPEEQKEMMDAMLNAMKEGTSYTFNADGSYEQVSPNPFSEGESITNNGTWSVNEEGNMLTINTELESGETKTENISVEVAEGSVKMMIEDAERGTTTTMSLVKK